MNKNSLKVLELFAGIGAPRKALKNIGMPHEVVGISEIDKYAERSYQAVFALEGGGGELLRYNQNQS